MIDVIHAEGKIVVDSQPYHLILTYISGSLSYRLVKLQISSITTMQHNAMPYNTIQLCDIRALFGIFLETNKHQNLTRRR